MNRIRIHYRNGKADTDGFGIPNASPFGLGKALKRRAHSTYDNRNRRERLRKMHILKRQKWLLSDQNERVSTKIFH